jgi:DNA-binding IclR family transcriptional regulator
MRSVTRTLTILAALGQYPEGIGVTDLAKLVSLPASSLHRTLQALAKHNVVWQNPLTRDYALGIGLLDLTLPVLEHHIGELRQSALAPLVELTQRTRSQVYVSVLAQDAVVGIESARPGRGQRVQVFSHDSRPMPMHCGAAAKAILAFLPLPTADSLIRRCTFRPYTMYTILSADDLWQQLEQARNRGYAVCEEEFELGVTALAVPILDHDGSAFASLGLCAPSARVDDKFRQRVARLLAQSARAISEQIGRARRSRQAPRRQAAPNWSDALALTATHS